MNDYHEEEVEAIGAREVIRLQYNTSVPWLTIYNVFSCAAYPLAGFHPRNQHVIKRHTPFMIPFSSFPCFPTFAVEPIC